jgi:hypothetical protein
MPRDAQMNQNRFLFIQIQTLHPSTHRKWKEITDIVGTATNGIGDQTPSSGLTLLSPHYVYYVALQGLGIVKHSLASEPLFVSFFICGFNCTMTR